MTWRKIIGIMHKLEERVKIIREFLTKGYVDDYISECPFCGERIYKHELPSEDANIKYCPIADVYIVYLYERGVMVLAPDLDKAYKALRMHYDFDKYTLDDIIRECGIYYVKG